MGKEVIGCLRIEDPIIFHHRYQICVNSIFTYIHIIIIIIIILIIHVPVIIT